MRTPWILLSLFCVCFWTACGGGDSPPPPEVNPSHLFVANSGDDTISRFMIEKNTGVLRSSGTATSISPGQAPLALGLVNNSRLVSANQDTYNTGVFNIDSTTGVLTQATNSPFPDFGGQHNGIAVHPSGKFIYVTSQPVGLIALQIDAASGALSPITGSPFGNIIQYLPIIDPEGKYLYTYGNQNLNVYSIEETSGILHEVPGSPFPSNAQSLSGLAFGGAGGKFLLGVEGGYLYLHTYSVDPTTGVPTEISGSPILQPGVDPWKIVVFDSYAFTSNVTRGTIATWLFDKVNGTLTWVGEVNAGTYPEAMVLVGKYLYVANYRSNDVSAYSINSTGALTELPGSPYAVGSFPADLVATK
jgi:6-phosphogluconolactonase (cycloisomerase 2 family)